MIVRSVADPNILVVGSVAVPTLVGSTGQAGRYSRDGIVPVGDPQFATLSSAYARGAPAPT